MGGATLFFKIILECLRLKTLKPSKSTALTLIAGSALESLGGI